MTIDRYRIDWASDRVYEYLPKYGAYYYLGGFIALGITHDDSNAQAIAKIENKKQGGFQWP